MSRLLGFEANRKHILTSLNTELMVIKMLIFSIKFGQLTFLFFR